MPRTRRRGARTARGTPFPLHLSRVGRVYLRERQGSTPRAPTKSSRTAATALAPAPEAVRAITAHRRALLAHPATPRVRVTPVSICLCVCLSCARRRQCGAPGATAGIDSTPVGRPLSHRLVAGKSRRTSFLRVHLLPAQDRAKRCLQFLPACRVVLRVVDVRLADPVPFLGPCSSAKHVE